MPRFYSNENIARQTVERLRLLGHDVLTSMDAGRANSAVPDEEVLAFATEERRMLLSHNRRDFLRLHWNRISDHAGMVLCTVDSNAESLAYRIDVAVRAVSDATNLVIRVNRST